MATADAILGAPPIAGRRRLRREIWTQT